MSSFLADSHVEVPLICGAMYPCSNPELVAAASEAGALGIIQPLSLTFAHGYELREGIQKIKSLTQKPLGFNLLVESSAKIYHNRMQNYLQIALDEGIRFFITALGNPKWVVDQVTPFGGIVYHDVTEKRFAEKALQNGVRGLICVNDRAGGHAGKKTAQDLYHELKDLNVPLICAGGVGSPEQFKEALDLGYEGVQMGTRFIATQECSAHEEYKQAILKAEEKDIVLTNRVTGVDLAVIRSAYFDKIGYRVGPIAEFLLKHRRTKHWTRLFYQALSMFRLRSSNFRALSTKDFWQAGKSVGTIHEIEPVRALVERFKSVLRMK